MPLPFRIIATVAGLGLAMSPILGIAQPKIDRNPDATNTCAAGGSRSCGRVASLSPKTEIVVGDVINPQQIHVVRTPGTYGLSVAPYGNGYGVISGHLIRFDSRSGQIMSILRLVDDVRD